MFIDGVARGIWNFLPIFVVDLRGNILDVAFLATLPGLASTLMQLPWGIVTTNHSRSKHLWAFGYLVIAFHAVPIAFATEPWQVIVVSTLRALFAAPMGLASGLFYWAALKPEIRARFMSINNSVGWFGMTLGSLLAGYVIQGYGYFFPFILFGLLNAACAFIILRLRDVEPSDHVPSRQLFREGFTSIGKAYQELPKWLEEERDYTMYCIGIAIRGLGLAITGPIFTIHLRSAE